MDMNAPLIANGIIKLDIANTNTIAPSPIANDRAAFPNSSILSNDFCPISIKANPINPIINTAPMAPLIAGRINRDVRAKEPAKTNMPIPTPFSLPKVSIFLSSSILDAIDIAPSIKNNDNAISGDATATSNNSGVAKNI